WVAPAAGAVVLSPTGWIGAAPARAPRRPAVIRNVLMGSATMVATYLIGLLFGVATG
ncbi:VIT family protein, partial [Burkholderia multivorans]